MQIQVCCSFRWKNANSYSLCHRTSEVTALWTPKFGNYGLKRKYSNLVSEYIGYRSLEECDAKNKIKMSVRYLEKHYYNDISVNQLAELYDMTPNYFSSLLKKEIGQSAVNYITNLRISKAKELLKNTDKSVVEIAELIGYNDSNYFFRVFKKNTGVTPHQYRVIKARTEASKGENEQ